jgi:hypothetical protein
MDSLSGLFDVGSYLKFSHSSFGLSMLGRIRGFSLRRFGCSEVWSFEAQWFDVGCSRFSG